MNKKILFFSIFIIFFITIISYSVSKANSDQSYKIIINEIGAYEDSNNEWIEILNVSQNQIDLTGWKFYESSTKHSLKAYQEDLIIESNEYAIIANDGTSFLNKNINFQGTIIDSSWSSLSEDGEEIGLMDSVGNFIELFTYIPNKNFSLERRDPFANIFTAENWQEHLNSNTAGKENSNYNSSNSNQNTNNESQTNEENTENETLEETKPIQTPSDVSNFSIFFDGTVLNLKWDFPENISKALILKSTNSISATLENNVSYSNTSINDTEIFLIQDENIFKDLSPEPEKTYFYKIFTYDENYIYSTGIEDSISIPYIIKTNDIIINEFVSNPGENENEWIEFFNASSKTLDINESYLTDESATKHILNGEIKSKEYLVIENPKFALNNSGDTISLFNKYNQNIYSISYGTNKTITAPSQSHSAGTINGKWIIFSRPSKSKENQIINQPPKAIIKVQSGSLSGDGSVKINLDGSDSYDSDLDELKFKWDFGDGESSESKNPNTKTFDSSGEYNITLTVEDIWGEQDSDSIKVKVTEKENDGNNENPSSTKKSKTTNNSTKTKEKSPNNTTNNLNSVDKDLFKYIKISEFLPNPKAKDENSEWIEIFNSYNEKINLTGLFLDDAENGSSPFSLENQIISPNEYLTFKNSETKISLNQKKDSVRLINEDNIIYDEISYNEPTLENYSYAFINESWQWTNSLTPSSPNTLNNQNLNPDEIENPNVLRNLIVSDSSNIKIFINEIIPNPYGADNNQEWIELFNDNDFAINLKNWSIDDDEKGSSPYIFSKDILIGPKQYFVIYRYDSKINLNNNLDYVRLFDPNKLMRDQIYYENAEEGLSYAKFGGKWKWTEYATANTENIFQEKTDEEDIGDENFSEYKNGNLSDNILISEILPNPKGAEKDGEWIELYNKGEKDVNLGNWYLITDSKNAKKYIFSDQDTIKSKTYLIIKRAESKIALNNNGDTLYLYNFDEDIQNQVKYDKTIENESFALVELKNDINQNIKQAKFIDKVFAETINNPYWTWLKEISPGKANPVFHKISGKIAEKAQDYFYLETNAGQKLQINLDNTDLNKNRETNLFNDGNEIELIAKELNQNVFTLQELSSSKTSNETQNQNTDNNLSLKISITLGLISLLIITIWSLKEKGILKKILLKLVEIS